MRKILLPSLAAILAAGGIAWAATTTFSIGTSTGPGGVLTLFGSTSGSVTVQTAAVAGTGTLFQLPATNGSNTNVLQTDGSGITSWVAAGAGGTSCAIPQGRLTLTSATPVMTADVTTASTVYYDTYSGNLYPNWSGSAIACETITADEISMGLDAGVPHIASGSLYDIFATAASAICAGPAWSTTGTRGTGAGTTELQLKSGVWTNKNSLTHCWGGVAGVTDLGAIAANQGTYLGTIYGSASGQTKMQFAPAKASGGNNSFLGLYNAYQRVPYTSQSSDSAADYTYATATWRSTDNSNSNRISFVDGLAQSSSQAYTQNLEGDSTADCAIGINFNSTSASPPFQADHLGVLGAYFSLTTSGTFIPNLGLNYFQAMENSLTAVTCKFFISSGTAARQSLTATVNGM